MRNTTFDAAIGDTRFSMAERDLAGARSHLDTARALAKTDEQRQTAQRVGTVLDHLAEFWRGMQQAVGALQSGQNLAVKDTFVAVIEASPNELLIRSAGRNLHYRLVDLPGGLVLAVAESWFEKTDTSKLLVGTFLCFDAEGNADMGRRLLGDASKGGVDVKPFLAELAAGGSGADLGKTRTGPGAANRPAPADLADPVAQKPPADPAALREAEEAVRKKFAKELRAATAPAAKSELAEKLMEEAVRESPSVSIAMLREALRLAVASGRVDLAMSAVDALGAMRAVDPLAVKAGALKELLETARGPTGQRQVAQAALHLIDQAAADRRAAEASRLADVAIAAARASNNASLMRHAAFVKQRIEASQKK